DRPSVNLPHCAFSAAIIGDSQAKYLFHHFDPLAGDSPGFISCRGARIADVPSLIVKLPQGITRLILHVGSNDIARNGAARVCRDYVWMIRQLQRSGPELQSIHVSLVLPRHTNRRRDNMNGGFVRRFNYEARNFNQEMKRLCYEDLAKVYFIDHGFHQLPPWRFLAADEFTPVSKASHYCRSTSNLCLDMAEPTGPLIGLTGFQLLLRLAREVNSIHPFLPQQRKQALALFRHSPLTLCLRP
ncbi:hypothetical protein HPB47_013490, partial [Ixodes persulcatus]